MSGWASSQSEYHSRPCIVVITSHRKPDALYSKFRITPAAGSFLAPSYQGGMALHPGTSAASIMRASLQ